MSINTLLIDDVDYTSYLKSESLAADFGSDNKSEAFFTLVINASDLGTDDGLIVGKDVKIKEDSTVRFGGIIKKIDVMKYEAGIGTDKVLTIDVVCNDYNDIPSRRVTSVQLEDTTGGGVAAQMVLDMNYAGYSDNIGTGTIDTGATFNTYIKNAATVKDILDEIALASGYKWYIDELKKLNFVQEQTITNAAHDLIETGATFTDFNVTNLEVSLENYRNKQWVLGALDDTGAKVNVAAESATEISNRATIEGGSGVYGQVINATQSQNTTDALVTANNALKVSGKIPYIISFTSYTNDWVAGTKLKCNLPTIGINSDMYFLIESVTIVDVGCVLMSEVTATRRDDSSFSTQRSETFVDYFSKVVKNNSNGVEGGINGAASSGRDYDLPVSADLPLVISTTPLVRDVEVVLPIKADLLTLLTLEYVATSAVTLTVAYKDDGTLKRTFVVDLPSGDGTKTLHIPEIEHTAGTFNITFEFAASINSVLTFTDYLTTVRWEQYIEPYTETVEPPSDVWVDLAEPSKAYTILKDDAQKTAFYNNKIYADLSTIGIASYDVVNDTWDETLSQATVFTDYSGRYGSKLFFWSGSIDCFVSYDCDTDTWDEVGTTPTSDPFSDRVIVGSDIYCKLSPGNVFAKYDTVTKVWDYTLTQPGAVIYTPVYVDGKIYVRRFGDTMIYYNIALDSWSGQSADPGNYWKNPIEVDGDIYMVDASSSNRVYWKFNVSTFSWDTSLTNASGKIVYNTPLGSKIFARTDVSPFTRLFEYNTLTDTWDETLATTTGIIVRPEVAGEFIYASDAYDEYAFKKYIPK
jgi:hypothetical protein